MGSDQRSVMDVLWLCGVLTLLLGGAAVFCGLCIRSPPMTVPGCQQVRLLLVTAHPDDECMFFGPALAAYNSSGAVVHWLCLSNGGFDGLGDSRTKELTAAGHAMLSLPQSRLRCIDDPVLQDGMRSRWAEDDVARHVNKLRAEWRINEILTFDAAGVSQHPNHIAAHLGVRRALELVPGCTAWQLHTAAIPLKYCGPIGAALQRFTTNSDARWLSGSEAPAVAWRGMLAHPSQLVWYRWLFMLFSTYAYGNRVLPMKSNI